MGLGFQDVGPIVTFHEIMRGTARPKQDEPVIDDSSAQGSEADTINVGDLEDYCWSRGNGQYRYPNSAQLFLHSQQEEREWDETEPPVRLKKARACPKPAPLYKEDFSDTGI